MKKEKKMFKVLWLMLLTIGLQASNTYVIVDMSKGMSTKAYKELGRLTQVKKENSMYTNGEKVHLFAFKGSSIQKKSFVYYEKNTKEQAYKAAKKQHGKFFKKIKKGKKISKKNLIKANVVFLVDTSGSMVTKRGNLLTQVKNSIRHFIKNKSKKSEVSIITFDGKKNHKEQTRSKILIQNETSKRELFKTINNIKVSKYDTFLGSGLKKVQEVLPLDSKRKNLVMIFTDGAKINDYDVAIDELEKLKENNVEVKVLAVGGADIEMLKAFSTSNYVYNATSVDLKSLWKDVSTNSDAVIVQLNNYFSNKTLEKGDRVIIYSTFMNIDSISDFSLVPNLASADFYKELKEQNDKRNIDLNLSGATVYARVIGNPKSEDVNVLKSFWKPFFKDANAVLKYFNSNPFLKEDF